MKRRKRNTVTHNKRLRRFKSRKQARGPASRSEQRPEMLGVDYMEIPCSIAKSYRSGAKELEPLILGDVDAFGALRNMRYQCQECTRLFYNRRSWEKHKGIDWIHASGIEVCT